jgi:hypothetical protein
MSNLGTILLAFSFVLAVLAAFGWPTVVRPHLGWAAFAFLIAWLLFGALGLGGSPVSPLTHRGDILGLMAYAQEAAPVTQNTVTTTGPVASETTISVGTLAGQVLDWAAVMFGGILTAYASYLMQRVAAHFGVQISEAARAEFANHLLHAVNLGAAEAQKGMQGKDPVKVKNATVAFAVDYIRNHHADLAKSIKIDPSTHNGVERIEAQIETAITDPTVPTPAILAQPAAKKLSTPLTFNEKVAEAATDYNLRPA